ncbi:MAG: hypothetical protein E6K80_06045 [Candidatus Eisenbacteria bacterium]|uniref:Uncharacterized protein n=1 Tax=Eiseniibacteriota bacterium TaxID=2212470 RepID=A0A538U604_UNCEI|nr:MAG: hypothetical protein E6K80_06045 [Candidatus Eisenbacteria bacterium]
MKRALLLAGLLAVLAAPAWAQRTYLGFQLSYRNAPPPPQIYFRDRPSLRYEPSSRVYIVEDADQYGVDMFRYGRFWYMTRNGWWYRSRSYGGPFYAIDPRDVPQRIYYVPSAEWRYHPRGGWPRDNRYGYNDRYDRDRYNRYSRYDRNDRYNDRSDRGNYRGGDRTYLGFYVDVTSAPPPPDIYFRAEPEAVYVPESGVYVVRDADFDMFRYGGYWYVSDGGYWYRSSSYRGPFGVIDAHSVPSAIYSTPDRNWRNPPRRDDRD